MGIATARGARMFFFAITNAKNTGKLNSTDLRSQVDAEVA
jgi:hypothetical protein